MDLLPCLVIAMLSWITLLLNLFVVQKASGNFWLEFCLGFTSLSVSAIALNSMTSQQFDKWQADREREKSKKPQASNYVLSASNDSSLEISGVAAGTPY